MPYVKQTSRAYINSGGQPYSHGDLNYAITKLCNEYIDAEGESYNVYAAVIGDLECAKLEMYRRRVARYEDLKIVENGDCYTLLR